MDYRKLIKFGKSSYVISIPKDWIRKNRLNKGDLVYIDDQKGNLILSPEEKKEERIQKSIVLNTNNKKIDLIKRELAGAYIQNYNKIVLKGNNITKNSDQIREVVNNLMALEIIEQNSDKIVAKDFLDITSITINSVIRKIDLILRTMLLDSIKCITEDSKDLAKNLNQRDLDVNRFTYIVYRSVRYNIDRGQENNFELLKYWHIATHMESLGDEIKRSVRYTQGMNQEKKKKVQKIIELNYNAFLQLMKIIYADKGQENHDLITMKNDSLNMIDQFFRGENSQPEMIKLTERLTGITMEIYNISKVLYH